MEKNRAQKDILYIAVSSFILVVIWITSNLYHASISSTIAPILQLQIVPIDPSFDTATINKLKSRVSVSPDYNINIATAEAVPAPQQASPTPTPATSQGPNLETVPSGNP